MGSVPVEQDKLEMRPSSLPVLPPEIIQLIVESVLPSNPRVILPTSHSAARTLLALTRVSRVTYKLASKLLRQRCLYIDSARRLRAVMKCMDRFVPTLPATMSLRNVTSLYLEPFEASLNEPATAVLVSELLCQVSVTLRRLVVKMPFRSLDQPDDRSNVRRILRQGFEQLVNLEEFVCLGEYPTLSLNVPEAHTDVWRLWPDLSRLVLFDVPADSHWLWWDIATLPQLQHVVLAHPVAIDGVNIKDEYFHKLPPGDPALQRDIRVVVMSVSLEMYTLNVQDWERIDPKDRMTVERYEVPMPFYGDESPRELVTGWVKRGALDGTLWEWKGDRVRSAAEQKAVNQVG